MSDDAGFFAIVACALIAFAAIIICVVVTGNAETERLTRECESKGGVYVRQLVGSGKHRHTVEMGCIKKEFFIE